METVIVHDKKWGVTCNVGMGGAISCKENTRENNLLHHRYYGLNPFFLEGTVPLLTTNPCNASQSPK